MVTGIPELDPETAQHWIARWEIQQQGYLPDREDRFTALIDAVEEAAGPPDPLVLDLGCGPGSLSVRLLDRMPAARVRRHRHRPGAAGARPRRVRRRGTGSGSPTCDLRSHGWTGSARPGPARRRGGEHHGAALAAPSRRCTSCTRGWPRVLRPGGLLLDGDHLKDDATAAPTLARLGQALIEREEQRRFPDGLPESWPGWWEAIKEDPALAAPAAQREQRRLTENHHGSESVQLATHVDGLRAAGFARSAPSGSAARTASWPACSAAEPWQPG